MVADTCLIASAHKTDSPGIGRDQINRLRDTEQKMRMTGAPSTNMDTSTTEAPGAAKTLMSLAARPARDDRAAARNRETTWK